MNTSNVETKHDTQTVVTVPLWTQNVGVYYNAYLEDNNKDGTKQETPATTTQHQQTGDQLDHHE